MLTIQLLSTPVVPALSIDQVMLAMAADIAVTIRASREDIPCILLALAATHTRPSDVRVIQRSGVSR